MIRLKFMMLLAFNIFCSAALHAQGLMADQHEKNYSAQRNSEKAYAKKAFVFESFTAVEEELSSVSSYDAHFLGDQVARRIKAVNELYIKRTAVDVGFGSTHTTLLKPDILSALRKIERYYKKATRRGEISEQEAASKMIEFLDYAIIIFYEHDSEKFEKALGNEKKAEAMIELFESVEIIPL